MELSRLPARNFQRATFAGADAVSGETLTETRFSRRNGCASCTIRCERLFRSSRGHEQRLEYETLFALGPLCGIDDPDYVIGAARLCDEYGLDAISTGGTLAWAIESADRGVLPEAAALGLGFGRGVGDLLAEGSRRAAMATGHGSAEWAMHVKGLEVPRSGAYEADFSGEVDRLRGDAARGSLVAASEDRAAVTGWDCTAAELQRTGERIHTLKKLFNIRERWAPDDDWLPPRLLNEPLASGVAAGVSLSPGELREMIRGYYHARQWDDRGFVPEWKRESLALVDP